ncbi:class II aldolase/adducin family protein [Salinisphaera hydrothermalis]|uniref:Class II aldolase/adducin family protein n=1 Tax=Salinisphaera hydrothermalis (strain C41B8) TaxID=1304275 RepID=A0A084IPS5_SALHC|nr:class II aldolase/adducin family protein [Salinisphaera hydrothermalis]KEZ78709.1 class II aldolase/adducin family protein [Salinisphaera hydrothermalis C41B8]
MTASTTEQALREHICAIGQRLYQREMGAANDGNISVKLDDERLLCSPTGVSKGFMTPDMICLIDYNGDPIGDNGRKPSSEIRMHLHVYQHRPDVNAVVHAHPLYATVHAICGKPLTQQIMPESTILLGEVPIAPYGTPSTMDLPNSITDYLQTHDALLLENHGALSYGADLDNAHFKMEALDYYAKVVYLASQYGGAHEFSDAEVAKLIELRKNRFKLPGRHPLVDGRD